MTQFKWSSKDGKVSVSINDEFRKVCPGCGASKQIADFGFLNDSWDNVKKVAKHPAVIRNQPNCRSCRSGRSASPPVLDVDGNAWIVKEANVLLDEKGIPHSFTDDELDDMFNVH